MPYKFKKEGNKYVVYKKSGQKVGSTDANKESLRKYLAALHINVKESNINEDEKQLRDQQIKTAVQDIKAKELALKDAKLKLQKLKNRTIPISEKVINESRQFEDGDKVKIDKPGYTDSGKIGYIIDISPSDKYFTVKFKDGKTAYFHESCLKLMGRPSLEETNVSLFDFHTDLKERKMDDGSEDPKNDKAEPAADAPEDATDADQGSDADTEDTPTNKPAKVKFNLSRVKQYNTYPIATNNGIITGATKEGLSVLVGDSTITVSYKDIIE